VQYSALIVTHQMTRDEALHKLATPVYDEAMISRDMDYVAAKLGITVDELRHYHQLPKKTHRDYRTQEWLFLAGARVMKALGLEVGGKR
jgi:hypothetical protein